MSRLGGLDGFEVFPFGEVGICAISRQVGGAGFSHGGIKLLSEEGEQGRAPGLQAIRGAFGRGMGGKKGGDVREMWVEPGFERKPSGEKGRGGNSENLRQRFEGRPVG